MFYRVKVIIQTKLIHPDSAMHSEKIPTILDEKSTKSLSNFENKLPNCTILFIFVYQ